MVMGCLFAHGSHANAPFLLLAMSFLHASAFLASCGSSPAAAAGFSRDFANLWGPQHQTVSGDGSTVTIWLDRHSGSGFRSRRAFRTGYFAASIRLQPGYTAGVITAFYLSNNQAHPGFHDEVDIEFLGTTPGRPYTLQTNVYVRGSGDGRVIGREMKFHLWFDPTADSHSYAILWGPSEIAFFVDGVPIRRYPRLASMATATFPARPMWVYGTIWDASSWATDNGRYRVDYRYQPFVARFSGFVVRACAADAPPRCRHGSAGAQLSRQQVAAMERVQQRYMVYNYCRDPKRDHSLTPECAHRPA